MACAIDLSCKNTLHTSGSSARVSPPQGTLLDLYSEEAVQSSQSLNLVSLCKGNVSVVSISWGACLGAVSVECTLRARTLPDFPTTFEYSLGIQPVSVE